jgi:hypothetical protein
MGNQSKLIISNQLDKILTNQYYLPSNNSIDLLDDIYEVEEEDEDVDQSDIGQAIDLYRDRRQEEKYWLIPFYIYL